MFLDFFSINTIAFTVLGYPLSYLELVGTLLNIVSVWLIAKNKVLTWPIGNIAAVLFGILFFQIQLYADFFEQIYFLVTGFYGWYMWVQIKKGIRKQAQEDVPTWGNAREHWITGAVVVVGTAVLGYLMANIHLIAPSVFVEPASFPYLDSFTTILSFTATVLMIYRRISCWTLWILVDIIGIWLYFQKGVVFISLLYVIFLVLATSGLINWIKLTKVQKV
jgi:nicotinamide mononucleotide transporter